MDIFWRELFFGVKRAIPEQITTGGLLEEILLRISEGRNSEDFVKKSLEEFMAEYLEYFLKQSLCNFLKQSLDLFPKDFINAFLEDIHMISLAQF